MPRDLLRPEERAATPMPIDDLILNARRLARRKTPMGVSLVHLVGSPYIMANAARYHYFRNSIAELAQSHGAELDELAHGRLAVIAEDEATHAAIRKLLELEAEAAGGKALLASLLEEFRIPEQYMPLRERLEILQQTLKPEAKAEAEEAEAEDGPALAGALTPAVLAAIEARLDGVDLEPFVRRQQVFRHAHGWQPVYAEHFTSISELGFVYFPEVGLAYDEPLFSELCRHLDRLMLLALMLNRPWRRQRIGLNLGNAAWTTDEYQRLIKRLSDAERQRLTIELHWLDALRDQAEGGRAMAEMREAGFKIAIDRLGIEALPLLNLDRLDADWLKLVFDKRRLPLLLQPTYLEALRRCRPERLILSQCDDKLALELGQKLGIRHYQGWLIDRLAKADGSAEPTAEPVGSAA